jgi:hypothetical protein
MRIIFLNDFALNLTNNCKTIEVKQDYDPQGIHQMFLRLR